MFSNLTNNLGLTTKESTIFGDKTKDKPGDKLLLVYKKTGDYNNDTFNNFKKDVFENCKLTEIYITTEKDADNYDKIDITKYIVDKKIISYPLIDKNIIINNQKKENEEGNNKVNEIEIELESYEKTLEYFLKFKLEKNNYSYNHITDACNERYYFIAYKIEIDEDKNYNLSECKFSSCIYAAQRGTKNNFLINSISKSDSSLININKFNSDIKNSLEELKKLNGGKHHKKPKTHKKQKNKKRKTNKHKKT